MSEHSKILEDVYQLALTETALNDYSTDLPIYLADYIFVLGNSPVQVTQIFKNNKYLTKKELYEVI